MMWGVLVDYNIFSKKTSWHDRTLTHKANIVEPTEPC